MELKYVRFKRIGFVLWPRTDDLWHAHIGRSVRDPIVSAGFASVEGGKVRCWGRSESLGIGGVADDQEALAKQLGLQVATDHTVATD